MMLNPKISSSKKHQKRLKSPRSPLKLKNLNVTSSTSSSLTSSCSSSATATSISSEAATGCLRFFLSHHSSTLSKNASNSKLKCNVASKSPKSAPNVRNLRRNVVKNRGNLPNSDSFRNRLVKKDVDVPHPRKSSRCDLSTGVSKFASGFHLKLSNDSAGVSKLRKPGLRYDLSDQISGNSSGFEVNFSGNGSNLRKAGSRYDLSDGSSKNSSGFEVNCCDNAVNLRKPGSRYDRSDEMGKIATGVEVNVRCSSEVCTPVNNFGRGSDLVSLSGNNKAVKLMENDANCSDACRSPTPPPVQTSVSPEIQGGLTSVVPATPSTCYAAGHVLSGVTDKRKCRPKGILTIGNNNLFGSSKTRGSLIGGESVVSEQNSRRDSIVPSPTEASVCWLSSPCDGKKSESRGDGDALDNTNELRLNQCEKLLPFKLSDCSLSPSSSLGFSSEMLNKSNCTISTSDTSCLTPSSRGKSSELLHSDLSSEFRGVLGPSLDHMVCCPSPPFKVEFSPEQGKSKCDNEASPYLEDSLGSGNVMQTPDSNSSPSNFVLSHQSPTSNSRSPNFGLSELSPDPISRLWFECELNSVAEVLRGVSVSPRPSFEFNPLVKLDDSIELALSRQAIDTGTSNASISLPNSLPEPDITSRVFGVDESDCCRYLSDEEDNTFGLNPEQHDSNLARSELKRT
ncbi:uncharacterized protein LOC141596595 [Silene latifolia]|uniref:uncharacterized protein LOC141596595 n=1 Tax=Silene latifolia TaxID=37657 RepID=UPI003D76A50D